MEEIGTLIADVNCSISDAIKGALRGEKVIVLEDSTDIVSVELFNFTEQEAQYFYSMSKEINIDVEIHNNQL